MSDSMRVLAWIVNALMVFQLVELSTQQSIFKEDMNYPPTETGVSCMPIPHSIKLCRNLEYKEMRLPNLLAHDSISEVVSQSNSWVPLLKKCCHPDLQLFLCSLFTPVCIKDNNTEAPFRPGVPIYPCRTLCESVRDTCLPIIERHGFSWPIMFKCEKFPVAQGMCIERQSRVIPTCSPGEINSTNDTGSRPSGQCAQCENESDIDTLVNHYCANEFVIKVRIKKSKKYRKTDRKITVNKRRKKIYKTGSLVASDLKKLQLYMKKGMTCPCSQLETTKKIRKDYFLIMGRKSEGKLLVTVLHRWPKRHKIWKQIDKKYKSNIC